MIMKCFYVELRTRLDVCNDDPARAFDDDSSMGKFMFTVMLQLTNQAWCMFRFQVSC